MGFSIDYDFGILGWVVIALIGAAAIVVAYFLLTAVHQAQEVVLEDEETPRDPGP